MLQNHKKVNAAQLSQLFIEFDECDVCFAPGDVISGFVLVSATSQQQQPALHPPQPVGAMIVGQQQQQQRGAEQQWTSEDADTIPTDVVDNNRRMERQLEQQQQQQQCLEIVELKMRVHGGARLKDKHRVSEWITIFCGGAKNAKKLNLQ